MANDEGDGATINQKSFIGSVKKYIFAANNPLSNSVWDLNRPMILVNYWKAIVELLVDENAKRSHRLSIRLQGSIFSHCVGNCIYAPSGEK